MQRSWNLWRVAAVGSSLCLLVLFVYDRAGGNVFHKLGITDNQTPDDLLPASKTKAVLTIDSSNQMLPGSKSAAVITSDEQIPLSTPGRAELLPGSKSIVITPSENANLAPSGEVPATLNPPPRPPLSGSKKFAAQQLDEDSPTDNARAQQPAAQANPLPVQRAAPPLNNPPPQHRLLPGSKAPGNLIEIPNANSPPPPAQQQQSNIGSR